MAICSNTNCNKYYTSNSYNCSKCKASINFCSNQCLIDHVFSNHQKSDDIKPKLSVSRKPKLESPLKSVKGSSDPKPVSAFESNTSIFMKKGSYLDDLQIDDYFYYENFNIVKIGDRKNVLGSGSYGEVFLAQNVNDSKFFAMKVMEKEKILKQGISLQNIRQEIGIHLRLVHPNIIKMYSYNETKSCFLMILDYASKGNLYNVIRRSKGLDERTAFRYFIQTVAGVHFLHERGFIHRDIKPENLLIDEHDCLKICDFGWCVPVEAGEERMTFCGTFEYMAPELVNENAYGTEIDVWSLGVLLYELLHGYSPFRADRKNKNFSNKNEHKEIFQNINNNAIKFKADISGEVTDLIKSNRTNLELLVNDKDNRIKTGEIFKHPWVLAFEREELERERQARMDSVKSSQPKEEPLDGESEYKNLSDCKSIEGSGTKQKQSRSFNKKAYSQKSHTIKTKSSSQLEYIEEENFFDKVLQQVKIKNSTMKKRRNEDRSVSRDPTKKNLSAFPIEESQQYKELSKVSPVSSTQVTQSKPRFGNGLDKDFEEMENNLKSHYEKMQEISNRHKELSEQMRKNTGGQLNQMNGNIGVSHRKELSGIIEEDHAKSRDNTMNRFDSFAKKDSANPYELTFRGEEFSVLVKQSAKESVDKMAKGENKPEGPRQVDGQYRKDSDMEESYFLEGNRDNSKIRPDSNKISVESSNLKQTKDSRSVIESIMEENLETQEDLYSPLSKNNERTKLFSKSVKQGAEAQTKEIPVVHKDSKTSINNNNQNFYNYNNSINLMYSPSNHPINHQTSLKSDHKQFHSPGKYSDIANKKKSLSVIRSEESKFMNSYKEGKLSTRSACVMDKSKISAKANFYENSSNLNFDALDILESAQQVNHRKIMEKIKNKNNDSVFDRIFKPFRCGLD